MNIRIARIIFPVILTTTLFSYWAAFALLLVNKLFYKDLPGYVIGRICIWEGVALLAAILITRLLMFKWGNIQIINNGDGTQICLNAKYGWYFSIYFSIAIIIGIWQFWLFSMKF